MKRKIALFTLLFSCLCMPAFAISLDDAKAKGLVGERLDGYIGAVSSSPDAETAALVNNINRKRKEEYQKIAAKNGQPLAVVEKLAAGKLIERVQSGMYHMTPAGSWAQR